MTIDWNPEKADLSWLIPGRLAVGGDLQADHREAALQCADMVEQGVTHVLDLRSEFGDMRRMQRFAPSVSYRRIGRPDDGYNDPHGSWWLPVHQHVQEVLADPKAVLFIHCHMGVNRAPSAAFLALVAFFDYAPLDAYRLLREQRPYAYASYSLDALAWLDLRGDIDALRLLIRSYGNVAQTNEIINIIHRLKAGEQP